MDNPQLWHFFGFRKYLGGELNSPVVEWLNKGLMSVWSPTNDVCPSQVTEPESEAEPASAPSGPMSPRSVLERKASKGNGMERKATNIIGVPSEADGR
eukprot:1178580-Prorocentrum_minimum.AAC.1